MLPQKVTFIGFGLMAGSLAKALKKINPEIKIYAVSRTMASLEKAMSDNVLTNGFNKLNDLVTNVDLIFLCTPIKIMYDYIDELVKTIPKNCIITDIGSTKGEIIDYINSLENPPCFIGGHPMTGAEKTGYESATAHLYENAYYIMTPSKSTTKTSEIVLENLIRKIGAIPIKMGAEEHDRVTGSISHVPHIIASALVNMVKNLDTKENKMHMMAAGGFRDITRIASSSPEMWLSIVLSNRFQINKILDLYIKDLEDIKRKIYETKKEDIYRFFDTARNYRNSLPIQKKGLISSSYELIIDIEDKPGIIGEITTILGNHEINIVNINISNSREDEPGVLKLTLSNVESLSLSFEILKEIGYNVSKNK